MNQDTVVNLATQAMTLALKVAGPILLVGLVIGLVVSVFQAVTQIQEQSLSFIPKIVGVAVDRGDPRPLDARPAGQLRAEPVHVDPAAGGRMSQLTLSQLLKELGGGAQVTALLPRARARQPAVRAGAAVLLEDHSRRAFAGSSRSRWRSASRRVAVHGQHVPTDPLSVAGLIVVQVLVGLAFAFAVSALLTAVQTAGGLADIALGLLVRSDGRPDQRQPGRRVRAAVHDDRHRDVHRDRRRRLDAARHLAHVRAGAADQGAADHLARERRRAGVRSIFVAAIEVAAPVMLALLITDVAFGMVSRAVPQLNVFSVALPAEGGRRDARRRRLAAVPRRLDVRPDLHLGRHRPALPLDRLSLSHGPQRQDREADSQAQEGGPQEGPGRQEHRPQRGRSCCSAA